MGSQTESEKLFVLKRPVDRGPTKKEREGWKQEMEQGVHESDYRKNVDRNGREKKMKQVPKMIVGSQ